MTYNSRWMTEEEVSDLALNIAIKQLEAEFEMLDAGEAENMLRRFALELETTFTQVARRIMQVKDPFWTILLHLKYSGDYITRHFGIGALFIKNRVDEYEVAFVRAKTFTGTGENQVYLPINSSMLQPIPVPKWMPEPRWRSV